jgi:hypothetical protein
MIISPQDAIQLPLHDARIFRVDVTLTEDGYLKALVEVEVNPEESLEPFRKFGIKSSKVTLVFQDCWQVASNLLGFATGREVISTFDIIDPSELKQKLRSFNVGSATMVHFRIQASTGSQLDFVAETFSCYELK